jgi:hypothetical protein
MSMGHLTALSVATLHNVKLGWQTNKEMEEFGKMRSRPNWDSIQFAWRKTVTALVSITGALVKIGLQPSTSWIQVNSVTAKPTLSTSWYHCVPPLVNVESSEGFYKTVWISCDYNSCKQDPTWNLFQQATGLGREFSDSYSGHPRWQCWSGHPVSSLMFPWLSSLCYNVEGREFDSRWGHWIFFNLPNPFIRTMVLGSTRPLTEMSTRNLTGGKGWPAREADNLTAICKPIF